MLSVKSLTREGKSYNNPLWGVTFFTQENVVMAKAQEEGAVNKSQAIRDLMKAFPNKTPAEISAELTEKGIKVTPQFVSTIKANLKKKNKKKARASHAGAAASSAKPAQSGGMVAVTAAVDFIKAAGGISAAKAALDTVEEIGRTVGR